MKLRHMGPCIAGLAVAAAVVLVAFGASGARFALVLLACPVMMFFMMRMMTGGRHDAAPPSGRSKQDVVH